MPTVANDFSATTSNVLDSLQQIKSQYPGASGEVAALIARIFSLGEPAISDSLVLRGESYVVERRLQSYAAIASIPRCSVEEDDPQHMPRQILFGAVLLVVAVMGDAVCVVLDSKLVWVNYQEFLCRTVFLPALTRVDLEWIAFGKSESETVLAPDGWSAPLTRWQRLMADADWLGEYRQQKHPMAP